MASQFKQLEPLTVTIQARTVTNMTQEHYTPHPLEKALTKQIRAEMAANNTPQGQLAKTIGISRGALNRYLQNHVSLPYSTIVDIADTLNITPTELIHRAEHRID